MSVEDNQLVDDIDDYSSYCSVDSICNDAESNNDVNDKNFDDEDDTNFSREVDSFVVSVLEYCVRDLCDGNLKGESILGYSENESSDFLYENSNLTVHNKEHIAKIPELQISAKVLTPHKYPLKLSSRRGISRQVIEQGIPPARPNTAISTIKISIPKIKLPANQFVPSVEKCNEGEISSVSIERNYVSKLPQLFESVEHQYSLINMSFFNKDKLLQRRPSDHAEQDKKIQYSPRKRSALMSPRFDSCSVISLKSYDSVINNPLFRSRPSRLRRDVVEEENYEEAPFIRPKTVFNHPNFVKRITFLPNNQASSKGERLGLAKSASIFSHCKDYNQRKYVSF